MLISSTDLSIDQIIEEAISRDGVVILLMDKPSYSIISQLGFKIGGWNDRDKWL